MVSRVIAYLGERAGGIGIDLGWTGATVRHDGGAAASWVVGRTVERMDQVELTDRDRAILVFDKWTGNANRRQAVFWRKPRDRKYNITFIDQGYCFNAGEWTFPDSPLRGVYSRNHVYAGVSSWSSFEPWLSRIENFDPNVLRQLAEDIPPEWYGGDWEDLEKLTGELVLRRTKVRDLITAFRNSSREPFPQWKA